MGFTVTGKLNKAAEVHEAQKGGAVYRVSIGKKEFDRVSKESVWVNYSAGLYASEKQRSYYDQVLVKGAVISVSANSLIPNIWQGNDGQKVYLNLEGASLEYAATGYDSETNQQGFEQARAAVDKKPAPSDTSFGDIPDDDIPF